MISEQELKFLYTDKEMTIKEISQSLGCSVGTVCNYMHKYHIRSRPRITDRTKHRISQAMVGKKSRKDIPASDETKKKMSESHKGLFLKPSEFGGHRKCRTDGYISIYFPSHPKATKDGYVMEHILVMERKIGRHLRNGEVVHHINKNRCDNRVENLMLMTKSEHTSMHLKERWKKERKNQNE